MVQYTCRICKGSERLPYHMLIMWNKTNLQSMVMLGVWGLKIAFSEIESGVFSKTIHCTRLMRIASQCRTRSMYLIHHKTYAAKPQSKLKSKP